MSKFQVIATLNTHLLNTESLEGMHRHGATILRINGSHIQPAELAHYAKEVRKVLGHRINILVDLPGNKIRTAMLSQPIPLRAGKTFELFAAQVNYPGFVGVLKVGDVILANDSLYKFTVVSANAEKATLSSHTDGLLISNKGMHLIGRPLDLPFLFPRDRELLASAKENGLDYIGYSFVRTAADVDEAMAAIKGTPLKAIIKVETAPAVENLDAILDRAEEFLVDRGDLSCDVTIERVDHYQKLILKRGKLRGKKVYFATQFLHSMLENNVPLIAEACGLADAIHCGVDGIQLSEETAIGKHPLEVLETVQRTLRANPQHARLRDQSGVAPVLWLTGRSGAGKTTITNQLAAQLEAAGLRCCVVDGDDFRAFFNNDVGYTKEDRIRNQRNIAFTAFQASKSFDLVIVSSLSPYRELRAFAREKLARFHEIFVDCSQETCVARDPKGHYKNTAQAKDANFVGVTEEYEAPASPELTLNTQILSAEQAASTLAAYVFKIGKNHA